MMQFEYLYAEAGAQQRKYFTTEVQRQKIKPNINLDGRYSEK